MSRSRPVSQYSDGGRPGRSSYAPPGPPPGPRRDVKRIVACCDGTWMNSLGKNNGKPPSNVTRISRAIRQTCLDGTPQVILYHPGIGSNGTKLDQFVGGAFGMGLDRDIREVYNFICNNYDDDDDIILIGFSRGAFTARSVADIVATLGLLNPRGLDHFYAIFDDYENIADAQRQHFLFSGLTPYKGESGKAKLKVDEQRKREYRRWLRDTKGWTRADVRIRALGVWDTVGTLGIPPAPVFGIRGSASQWKFTNTQVSNKVDNAFQALSLDEPRFAFRPALWERVGRNETNLKQVWFPGNHGGVGGGWFDQQISNITLAWMCDQLSTVGVEFNLHGMKEIFIDGLTYSAAHPYPFVPPSGLGGQPDSLPWATHPVCRGIRRGQKPDGTDCDGTRHPAGPPRNRLAELWEMARPWALGQTRAPTSKLQLFAGKTVRHPGLFMRADTATNADTDTPLQRTAERVHSSVRVRLAARGLGLDDRAEWECEALTRADGGGPLWKLENRPGLDKEEGYALRDFEPRELRWREYAEEHLYRFREGDGEWRWVYRGDEETAPYDMVLPEEPLVGYWERLLLALTAGDVDVWRWAEENPPTWAMTRHGSRHRRSKA